MKFRDSGMYSFPQAAITNSHQLGDIKQQKCILSKSQWPEVQNQGVSRTQLPPEALGEEASWLLTASGSSRPPSPWGAPPESPPLFLRVFPSVWLLLFCLLWEEHQSLDLGPMTDNPGWSQVEILNLITSSEDCPGGPMAKTLCSQCRGSRFDPWWGN